MAQTPSLKPYYGWAALFVLAGVAVAYGLGPVPRAPLGVFLGGIVGIIPAASWHWMLAKQRRVWAYVVTMILKMAILFGGIWVMARNGWVTGGPLVIGIALAVFAAVPFGLRESRK